MPPICSAGMSHRCIISPRIAFSELEISTDLPWSIASGTITSLWGSRGRAWAPAQGDNGVAARMEA